MRNTIYALLDSEDVDREAIVKSVEDMVAAVQTYVPGYRLKNEPVFEVRQLPQGTAFAEAAAVKKKPVVTLLLEVTGAGDFLPAYAGNLDIMTAAARQVGEMFARKLLGVGD
jgi:acetaldehyde dehydrogenase